jgi:hypothetical protein
MLMVRFKFKFLLAFDLKAFDFYACFSFASPTTGWNRQQVDFRQPQREFATTQSGIIIRFSTTTK